MIETDPTKICYIIIKAREIQAKVGVENPIDPGAPSHASNATDDDFRGILEDYASDATYLELKEFLDGLNEQERTEILALMWLGRGDFSLAEWDDAMREAADRQDARETKYLMETPMLAGFLEEGLNAHDLTCAEVERDHL